MTITLSLVSVVDDDESIRESLPDLLRELGFAVQAFSSAEAFLDRKLSARPDASFSTSPCPGCQDWIFNRSWRGDATRSRLCS